jgi:aspartate carbamoyltransferase catalytic subunit
VPIINAGDGGHNHHQTLTVLATIRRDMAAGPSGGGACGDLKFCRTVLS